MTIVTKSLEETYVAAGKFLKTLTPSSQKAAVVGLFGDLGSGKTSFVQGLARALGVKENVTSPTFVIEKIYPVRSREGPQRAPASNGVDKLSLPYTHFIHIDAYRLESAKELLKLGWPELVNDPGNLVVIEWADRVEKILPRGSIKINFKFLDESTRQISWADS